MLTRGKTQHQLLSAVKQSECYGFKSRLCSLFSGLPWKGNAWLHDTCGKKGINLGCCSGTGDGGEHSWHLTAAHICPVFTTCLTLGHPGQANCSGRHCNPSRSTRERERPRSFSRAPSRRGGAGAFGFRTQGVPPRLAPFTTAPQGLRWSTAAVTFTVAPGQPGSRVGSHTCAPTRGPRPPPWALWAPPTCGVGGSR